MSLHEIIEEKGSPDANLLEDSENANDLIIYKVETNDQEQQDRYTRIRLEQIEFQQMVAIAVYFEEVTKNVQMMRLKSKIIQQKNIAQNLESYTSMISHEFRTPPGTVLMFIDMILGQLNQETNMQTIKLIEIIKSSLNLLLSLVNDIVDLKLIKEGKFTANQDIFSPL